MNQSKIPFFFSPGLMESAHVYKKGDDLYTAVLGLVSITSGTNSYYKLQLLESDSGKSYYLFRAWGRVGTTIGGNKLERFGGSIIGAMDQFLTLYGEKTGVDFDDRKSADKVPGKFYPLDIDFGAVSLRCGWGGGYYTHIYNSALAV